MEKKKYLIEVEEIQLEKNKAISRGSFPHHGFFYEKDIEGNIVLHYCPKQDGIYPTSIWTGEKPELKETEQYSPQPIQLQQELATGISENTLLKAIAIVQKPELSLNLLGNKEVEE